MKTFFKVVAIALLLFNGVGALYGGWNLISHPDGSSLQLSLDWLKYSPFDDYLIPGLILFVMNGIGSLIAISSVVYRLRNYAIYVLLEGVILTGWIAIQILILRTVIGLHIILGITGLLLILCGWLMLKDEKARLMMKL